MDGNTTPEGRPECPLPLPPLVEADCLEATMLAYKAQYGLH